ncbi:MAG: hypothetical protein Q4B30_00820 [Coriobacteriaceae bacterium]|nr:hypothetical protein [Coriobacteriaceae bacterium]
MANLRGEGAFKGVNLIVHAPANRVVKNEDGTIKGRYLDVQVDQSMVSPDKVAEGKREVDSNPHLASVRKDHPQGGTYVDHKAYYSESQYQAMVAAANTVDPNKKQRPKVATLENGDTVLGIVADVRKNASKQLIVATDKPMTANHGNSRFGKTVLDRQAAVTAAAKEVRAARRAEKAAELEAQADAQAAAPSAEAEAEAPFAE